MERQLGELSKIEVGHQRRYHFAAQRVSGQILDAACGCGYGSWIMKDSGEVTGMDIDPKTIIYARKNYPGKYKLHDISNPVEGYFDWAVSFETIEHVKEPERALKTFRDCAENLIISSPNSDHYPFKPENFAGDDYPHLRHYTPKELEGLLNSCGWEVLEKFGQWKKFKEVDKREGPFQVFICR